MGADMLVDAGAAAAAAATRADVTVRNLDTAAASHAAAELFCTVWQVSAQASPVNPDMIRALSHTGSFVVGAYREDRLIGASIAFFTGDRPVTLHSHISGIARGLQSRGVGFALKLHQRAWALDRGIDEVSWTMDPLVRRNAFFNLGKLGAAAVRYLPDFYGPMTDGINANDESDRLLISWPLTADRVAVACTGIPVPVEPTDQEPDRVRVLLREEPNGAPAAGEAPDGRPVLLCEIPADITALRAAGPTLARRWRHAVRDALGGALRDGYRVSGVTGAGHYVLTRVPADPTSAPGGRSY